LICVDANVVVALLVPVANTARAEVLVGAQNRAGEPIVAVDLLGYEVTNAFHRQVRAGTLSLEHARAALVRLPRLGIDFHPAAALHDRALVIAHEAGAGASYDAHYVALAEALGCHLWTADQKLVDALHPRYPFVRYLGDFGNA
jgi:predicted nucleic acid-binding protein